MRVIKFNKLFEMEMPEDPTKSILFGCVVSFFIIKRMVRCMKGLLMSYRQTRRKTKQNAESLKLKLAALELETEKPMYPDEIVELDIEIKKIKDDLTILNAMISSLKFSIDWMATGRMPGSMRGIDNRAAYDREIPFELNVMQRFPDETTVNLYERTEEELEDEQQSHMQKEEIAKSILSTLNKRERDVLQLISNKYTQQECAEMLGVSQQSISKTIANYERKIKNEGWFML